MHWVVRPQFGYCIQVWNPYLKQDVEYLEKVQKGTKIIVRFKDFIYEERLRRCRLIT